MQQQQQVFQAEDNKMAQASVETGSQGNILKQSSLKFVQEIKKSISNFDCELTFAGTELKWKPIPAVDGADSKEAEQKQESKASYNVSSPAFAEESVRGVWIVKAEAIAPPAQNNGEATGEATELQSSNLIIHYVKRHEQPAFRYSVAQVKFSGRSTLCSEWEIFLNELVTTTAPLRPKSLLIIVNPISGSKKGEKIYRDKAEPIFQLFGIETELVVTTKAKESSEILEKHDLSQFDGLVSVGGDGTHTEVCSALQELTMKTAGIETVTPDTVLQAPSIRHGMIPTGSGNGQQLVGTFSRDIITSVITIALGDSRLRDVLTVHCGEKLLAYAYLLVAYGLLSQVMEVLENNRWAGPARYLGAAFVTFVKRKSAELQVDYLPGDEDSFQDWNLSAASNLPQVNGTDKKGANSTASKKTEENNTNSEAKETNSEAKETKSEAKETKPEENKTTGEENKTTSKENKTSSEENKTSSEENKTTSEENKTTSEENKTTVEENKTEATNGDGDKKEETTEEKTDDAAKKEEGKAPEADGDVTASDKAEGATAETNPPEVEDPLAEGWKRVKGRFLGLDCFLGRADKVDDFQRLYNYEFIFESGLLGLALTEPCGRLEHAKFMRRLQKGEMQRAYRDSGFVNMVGVKAFNVKAIGDWRNSSKANTINWDGDVLYAPEPHFEVRCHNKVAQTFSRSDGEELREICKREAEEKERQLEKKASQKKPNNTVKKEKEEAGKDTSPVADGKIKATTESKGGEETEATKPESAGGGDTEESAPASPPEKDTSNLPKAEVEITVTEAPEVATENESQ